MSTVAAISTPRGKGGVALIRISGEDALQVCRKVFSPASGKDISEYPAGKAVHGYFCDKDGNFDDGMATMFISPRSFTGEDTAELCCHGGALVQEKLLKACFWAGAVPAGAGEFTRRAYINGKITLSQAEAVGGLIDAHSERYLQVSLRQLDGKMSERINALCNELILTAATVYAFIDYPDEDMTDMSVPEMLTRLNKVKTELKALAGTHKFGKAISEGIPTVIAGKPNTGKSTLMNLLCGTDRAIVTDIAGTTRDVITEQVKVGDVLLNLADTAGIRESEETVEAAGIKRSIKEIERASLIIAVFDCSSPLTDEDNELVSLLKGKEDRVITVMNKCDMGEKTASPFENAVYMSAAKGEGFEELQKKILSFAGASEADTQDIVVSARQYSAIERALENIEDAITALDGFTQDIAGECIERAVSALGEIDGRTAALEIVNEIFSHFCVGK